MICVMRRITFFVVGYLLGGEVAPLAGAVDGFFRVKVLYGVAQGVESDGMVGTYEQSFSAFTA